MGWTSFINDALSGERIKIEVDNRGNVIFGDGNDNVSGYGNVIFGNGDSNVSGNGNVVFGNNSVAGFGNVLLGSDNDVSGNGNVLLDAFNNTVNGNGNILGGVKDLDINGDEQEHFADTNWLEDFNTGLGDRFDFDDLPVIEISSNSSDAGGSIVLTSDLGNNNVEGTDGPDILVGGEKSDTINGLDGDDILVGSEGNDRLDAGAGDDIIVGEEGNDILTGGEGADLFGFSPGQGHDIVTDFDVSEDTLHFSGKNQLSSLSDVLGAAKESNAGNGGTIIAIPEGGSIFLEGISMVELASASMQFE